MVCDRCIMAVRQLLEDTGFESSSITLGTANIYPEPDSVQISMLASKLRAIGFELIDKEKDQLVERIKNVVIELVHHTALTELEQPIAQVIASRIGRDYTSLSRLFSDSANLTIEKFIIHQKIEKVKELLEYGELNLNEIALKMDYSSSAHLSAQFKTIAGHTPSKYKQLKGQQRNAIDKI